MMLRGIVCAVMVMCFAFASAESFSDSDIGALYEERTVSPSDINPEADFIGDEIDQGFTPGSRHQILETIVHLRAYCVLAYDKAKNFVDEHPRSNSGLVSFILAFGKKDTKTQKMSNIVTGFATAIGEVKSKFKIGISHYLLMHLGKAVFEGKKAVKRGTAFGKAIASFEAKTMGLSATPTYFNKIAVSYMPFVSMAAQVGEESKDADAEAAAAWLASGSKAKYNSFEEKEQATVDKKAKKYEEDVYMNSLKAIKTSWAKSHSLSPMPVAGSIAGASVPAVEVPNTEQVAQAARSAAQKWIKDNQADADQSAAQSAEKDAENK